MGPQGFARHLLSAMQVPAQMWSQCLAPLAGNLPTAEDELQGVAAYIRRLAHLGARRHPAGRTQRDTAHTLRHSGGAAASSYGPRSR